MGEKIMDKLTSKTAKIIYAVVAAFVMFLFGSWMTNQTLKQNLYGYKNFTISKVISNELDKTGGVNQQLTEIKGMLVTMQSKNDKKNAADYIDWVADIDKYYGWSDGKHDSMLSSGYLSKMSNHWGALPEEYKTDLVKLHYNYAFEYITKVCK